MIIGSPRNDVKPPAEAMRVGQTKVLHESDQPLLHVAAMINAICPRRELAFVWRNDALRLIIDLMSEVTQLLHAIDRGDPQATAQLLPLVYAELRKLAAQKLSHEKPGQTLEATALVHEAYLRLLGPSEQTDLNWANRAHFFAAAAEAMRRILVENARRKARKKHGGDLNRVELGDSDLATTTSDEHVLAINEALDSLAKADPQATELVKLRFFAGFSIAEAAQIIGVSRTNAYAQWAYARAWLRCEVEDRD